MILAGAHFVRSCEKITIPEGSGHMDPAVAAGTWKIANATVEPARFDAVAFHSRGNATAFEVGRVLGIPGDTVAITEGKLIVKDPQGRQVNTDQFSATRRSDGPDFLPYKVPHDCYFIVGDHRELTRVSVGSYFADSRRQGPIHRSLIAGTLRTSD